jgi:hypothetical protein
VLGLALGLLLPATAGWADEAATVQAILKLGGRVVMDEDRPGKPVVRVYLSGTRVRDADLAVLQGLPNLEELDLRNTGVTDAGLPALKQLRNLMTLKLVGTQVTDAGARALQAVLPQLQVIR